MKKLFVVALICSLCLFLSACSDGLCDICGAIADIEGTQKELCLKCFVEEAATLINEGVNNAFEGRKDCSSCGENISAEASFCEYCGASQNYEQSTTPFEPISFSGTGQKTFRDINLPSGKFVIVGKATMTENNYSVPNFDVYLKHFDGSYAAKWWDHLSSNNKTIEKMEPVLGPINGGYLEVDTDDNVSWTITIEVAN